MNRQTGLCTAARLRGSVEPGSMDALQFPQAYDYEVDVDVDDDDSARSFDARASDGEAERGPGEQIAKVCCNQTTIIACK